MADSLFNYRFSSIEKSRLDLKLQVYTGYGMKPEIGVRKFENYDTLSWKKHSAIYNATRISRIGVSQASSITTTS